jgi:hypothetical protein
MSNANQFIRFLVRPQFRTLMVTSVVFCVIQNATVQWLYSHLPYTEYKCALTPPFVTTYRTNLQLSIDVHLRCSPSTSGTYLWFVPRWPLHILNRGANFIQSIHTTFTPSVGKIINIWISVTLRFACCSLHLVLASMFCFGWLLL